MYAIRQYRQEIEKIKHYGGSDNEGSIRRAFASLLNHYADGHNLVLVEELSVKTAKGNTIRFDGVLKDILRLDWGYWEAKDESDNLDEEIAKKFRKGYPNDNILFEDSRTAVLIQGGTEVMRVDMAEESRLEKLLQAFVNYERPEVKNFRTAIELFKKDIPKVTEVLREKLMLQESTNPKFTQTRNDFWELCKQSINPTISTADIREMIIQHILTEDIFNTIFDETQFHRENNIAKELEKVISTFFVKEVKRETLGKIQHYYLTIKAAAAGIADHHEKQKFLKVIYETFYKGYNPKGADRLGIVYTPNEIVKFMIESTDYLLHKHFDKYLEDKGVEILDPATGTGTFITDIIDFIRKEKIEYKYKHEIHANEVAILPYYIANLNIEYTYSQKTGQYAEFENLCFVDTLDNVDFAFKGKQTGLFGTMSVENAERIKRQNERKISVIIGNPPYNANQQNANDNNKNREYKEIDKQIKDSFIKYSTAQKTKVYDMYARFFRWAMNRVDEKGIIAFITNRSFIESRTFDGFRKCVQEDFIDCYIIDTKSDVRANPKIAGTTHNVFGIQTGVAIMFLIKKPKETDQSCKIHYVTMLDEWRKEVKLQWFAENAFPKISFEIVRPDKNNNWINLAENSDWETLLPICSKEVKGGIGKEAIFKLFSNGIVTARDEWSYDFNVDFLINKAHFFCDFYKSEQKRWQNSNKQTEINDFVDRSIKFGSEIEDHLVKNHILEFDSNKIIQSTFRPFNNKYFYFSDIYTHRSYQLVNYFGEGSNKENLVISLLCLASSHELYCLAVNKIFDAGLLKQGNGITSSVSLYRYDKEGNRLENITDWALQQFISHYKAENITKEDIFHYVYAVLHNPAYRQKYELNLKRDFPRIPFYSDFDTWKAWGKQLMDLHINYETVEPYPLTIKQLAIEEGQKEKPKLKALKDTGEILLTDYCSLTGIPPEAWQYKLGNRSALEWVLDQYKESKPSDPTIAAQFNSYRFLDYKAEVIELLKRVCRVSVETVGIVGEMRKV